MKKRLVFLSVAALLALAPASPALQAQAAQQNITINYTIWHPQWPDSGYDLEFAAAEQPFVVNGRVLVPLRKLAENFGFSVDYFPEGGKIMLREENGKTIELARGQTKALVNGRQVALDMPSDVINGVTFVPLRFVAENFDLDVSWQSSDRTVRIVNHVISTPVYILDKRERALLRRGEPGEPNRLVADFSAFEQASRWELLSLGCTETANGNDVVVIRNNHGEPHLWNDCLQLYIADGQVVAQSCTEGSLSWNRFSCVSADGSRVIMNDGKTAVVYDDSSLQAVAEYDLRALVGQRVYADIPMAREYWYEDDSYAAFDVERFGDSWLLLRGAFHLLYMVVYTDSGQVDVVYKSVFSPEQRLVFERGYDEGPMGADLVRMDLEGEDGGFLVFICNLDNVSGHNAKYRYQLRL